MSGYLEPVFAALRTARERVGLSVAELDRELVLGPGWVDAIENGRVIPDLAMFALLCNRLNLEPGKVLAALPVDGSPVSIARSFRAEPDDGGLRIEFQYATYQATYRLPTASLEDFEDVLLTLRDGLAAEDAKADAVVRSFQAAMRHWPHANPSDIWWFVIYRAFTDAYNHPASRIGGDHAQSWTRTSGWALERIFVEHYAAELAKHGVTMSIETKERKRELMKHLKTGTTLNTDKADLLLLGIDRNGKEQCFGVVHVKASFAERRTDDEPMSSALAAAGYCTPLLTMDCKSTPSEVPINRGELGPADGDRGDKRKDIEVNGVFSGCFSYNKRTEPTTSRQAKARISVCSFSTANDAFVAHVVENWTRLKR